MSQFDDEHPREDADVRDCRRYTTGLDAGADWDTDPYAAGENSEALGADGAPRPDVLDMFVTAEGEDLATEVDRLVYGGEREAGAKHGKERLETPVSGPSPAVERPPGIHVAAERIVRLVTAYLRPYYREFPDELYSRMEPSIRGIVEEKVGDLLAGLMR